MLLDPDFKAELDDKRARTQELFYDYAFDMIKIIDRLPTEEEYRRVRHLILQTPLLPLLPPPSKDEEQEGNFLPRPPEDHPLAAQRLITDDEVAAILPSCPHLETVCLGGVLDTSDRTLVLLAANAINLQGLNVAKCTHVTDVGVLELTTKSLPLNWLVLNGVAGLTDPSISAIAKSCSRLLELEICNLPLLTPVAVRDIWSFSR
jgi:F-box and leucine-rich repeat protein GRR1